MHKKDKITLLKAVAQENNRGSIGLVQYTGRKRKPLASDKESGVAAKRRAIEKEKQQEKEKEKQQEKKQREKTRQYMVTRRGLRARK